MTIDAPANGDRFTLRIIKHHQLNPDRQWGNVYEFRSTDDQTIGSLNTLGSILVMFEQHLHLASTVFDRLLISTWQPDSKPYNPDVFISSSLTGIGLNPSGSNPIGLTQPLTVARMASTGRSGHLFYRNVLTEDIVSSPAGKTILDNRGDLQTIINTALSGTGLGDYIGVAPVESYQMVMINKTGTQIRPVTGLAAQGVTTLPIDHAWFNRTVTA